MSLLRLQHIGIVVKNLKDTCERFEVLYGLKSCDFRDCLSSETTKSRVDSVIFWYLYHWKPRKVVRIL